MKLQNDKYYTPTELANYCWDKVFEIVFDDLTEVDALIDMLKRFKQESQEYMGVWKRSGN